MSTNGNGWKPAMSEKWICPSGQEVYTRPPGPEFTLRLGRTQRAFTGNEATPKRREDQTDEQYAQEVLEKISDEELVTIARELLVAMLVSPKLSLNPKDGELGPDDTGMDFWPLYNYGMTKYYGRKEKIKVGEGESEVVVGAETLETFRDESGIQGDSVDGVHVPVTEPERTIADQGLVSGAGV